LKDISLKRKFSIKSKIIFLLLPILLLVLFELIFLIFSIAGFSSKADLDSENLIEPQAAPKIFKPDDFKRNFELQTTVSQQQLPFHKPDDKRFWRLRPGASFTFKTPDLGIVNYKINSIGFRDDEFHRIKTLGSRRIICAGDSATFGFYLNICDTYPFLLENMLNTKTTEKLTDVINAGVWCYSSYQGKIFVEDELLGMGADILIFSYGFNDTHSMKYTDTYKAKLRIKNINKNSGLRKLTTYRFLEKIIFVVREKAEKHANKRVNRVSPKEYQENIQYVADLCKERGIKLILMPISVPVEYSEIMKEVAIKNNIAFIDTEARLRTIFDQLCKEGAEEYQGMKIGKINRRKFQKEFRDRFGSDDMIRIRELDLVFMDFCHPMGVGNYIIAEAIYDHLIEEGIYTLSDNLLDAPLPSIEKPKKMPALIPILKEK